MIGINHFRQQWPLVLLCLASLFSQGAQAQKSYWNKPPTISGSPSTTATAGVKYSFTPQAVDPENRSLSFSIYGLPGWASFDRSTGKLSGTPVSSNVGTTDRIVIAVADRRSMAYLPAFRITVQSSSTPNSNVAPVISGAPSAVATVGAIYSFKPGASDANGDTLTFSVANKPAWAALNSATGLLTGTPTTAATHSGIVMTVSDGKVSASLPPFSIQVSAASTTNRAPTITGTPVTSIAVGAAYRFLPTSGDADGDKLTYSVKNGPFWSSVNVSTGLMVGTPTAAGTWAGIVINVSDGKSTTSLPAFTIQANAPATNNRPPVISGTPPTTVAAGTAYSFKPTASDADGNTLGFTIAGKPTWASFNTSTGLLSGTPIAAATHAGVVISVSDGKVATSLPAFSIPVTGATNSAPKISGSPVSSLNVGSAYLFKPVVSDANGDALTFSIANKPAWTTFNTTTGQLSGTPAPANVGTFAGIVISVSDGKATTSLGAFAIAVAQVSTGSATLTWTAPTANTDGTQLTNLASYRIYYGTSSAALTQTVDVTNASISTYVISNLSPGTWFFAVKAKSVAGVESDLSNVASKVVN